MFGGDSEIFWPLESSRGMNIIDDSYDTQELYQHSIKPQKGQDIWYSISMLPNMKLRQQKQTLCNYEIRKVGNQFYFGIVFATKQYNDHIQNNHEEISIKFEQSSGIKHFKADDCRYFMVGVLNMNNYNDTAQRLAEEAVKFYDKYHSLLVEIIEKYAPKYIERSGYIYE